MRAFLLPILSLLAAGTLALPTLAQPGSAITLQEQDPVEQTAKKQSTDPFYSLTAKEAFVEAAKQNKLSILIFLSSKEDASVRTLKEALSDETILKWLKENSVSVKLFAGNKDGWIKRKGINRFPTVSIRTANRRMVDVMHGYHSVEQWMTTLNAAKAAATAHTKPEGIAAKDPYSWLAYGSYLFGSAGDPDEIGNAFLWCMDHANESDPDFIRKHLDFLLRKLVQIARRSEGIDQGIHLRRDALHNRVVAGEATLFEAYALSRFGTFMRDMDDPIRAFNQIKPDTKHLKQTKSVLLWSNLERMVAYRRYFDITGHISQPEKIIASRIAAIKLLEKGVEQAPQPSSDMPRPPGSGQDASAGTKTEEEKIVPEPPMPGVIQTRSAMIIDASLLYECLLATNQPKEAKALMELVTDFEPIGKTYALFIERSNRLRMMDVSNATADRGVERVPEDHIWRIRNMIVRGTRGKK